MAYVKITALDDETDAPVPNAIVILGEQAIRNYSIIEPKDEERYLNFSRDTKRTDAMGVCTVSMMCRAGGGGGLFGKSGDYYLEGPIIIKSERHIEFRNLMQNILGKKRFRLSDSKHEITIYLQSSKKAPNKAPEPMPMAVTPPR